MFSYYGSKSKIVGCYPTPKYGLIIEPFAGSARYSLRYPENDVVLIERDPVIARIWHWLIYHATLSDINNLPDLKRGDDLRTITTLSDVERDLLGFAASAGVSRPCHIVTPRADASGWEKDDPRWRPNNACALLKRALKQNLPKIKHWQIVNIDYTTYTYNPQATWFIDPPYCSTAGRYYRYSQIDYESLAHWCRTRHGQIIVCEGQEATWLPFTPLQITHRGCRHPLQESMWIQDQ